MCPAEKIPPAWLEQVQKYSMTEHEGLTSLAKSGVRKETYIHV